MNKNLIPAVALAALGVVTTAGCGGSTPTASPTSSAAAPSTSAASEPSAAASSSAPAAEAKDPCTVLPASKVSELTGVKVADGKGGDVSGANTCSWAGGKAGSASYVVFTGQEGAAVGGSLDSVGDQLAKQFGGSVSKITVSGADDAIYLSGTKNGIVVDVLAKRGDVFYQMVVATPGGSKAESYKDASVKLVETMIAG